MTLSIGVSCSDMGISSQHMQLYAMAAVTKHALQESHTHTHTHTHTMQLTNGLGKHAQGVTLGQVSVIVPLQRASTDSSV